MSIYAKNVSIDWINNVVFFLTFELNMKKASWRSAQTEPQKGQRNIANLPKKEEMHKADNALKPYMETPLHSQHDAGETKMEEILRSL